MNSYKKISDYKDVNQLQNIKMLIDVYDAKKFSNLYFGYLEEYEGSFFQCVKSEKNNSTEKISSYNDEYVLEGNHEPDWIKQSFDETVEVHEGDTYSVSLRKLISTDFVDDFIAKVKNYYSSNGNNDDLTIQDFFDDSGIDYWGLTSYEDIIDELDGNDNDYEEIHDGTDIDENDNLIRWFSYVQSGNEYFFIGYK
jgi:hypothetical protein